jgi:hypothetical protein
MNQKSSIINDQWHRKIRREFEEYTNNDSRDYSIKIFSMNEQIDRYAKALTFWNIKLYNDECLPEESYMFQCFRTETHMKIQQNLPKNIQIKIIETANELFKNYVLWRILGILI